MGLFVFVALERTSFAIESPFRIFLFAFLALVMTLAAFFVRMTFATSFSAFAILRLVVMAFAFLFIFITALTVFADKGERRFSDALAFTTLIYMFWVLFTTNILSVFSGITQKVLLVFYLIPVAVAAASFPAVA